LKDDGTGCKRQQGKKKKGKEGICFSVNWRNGEMKSEMETVECNLKTMRSKVKVVRGEKLQSRKARY